jgi:hypothetical protein
MEKKMIDKYLYKVFSWLDNLIMKIGVFFDEGHKIIGKLFQKRKRKKSS